MPSEKVVTEKLESIKDYCGLDIPLENVIYFKNNAASLVDFVSNFVEGEANLVE